MDKLKNLRGLRFFLLLVLLPCVLFSALAGLAQSAADYSASAVSGTSGHGGTALPASNYYVLYSQYDTQGRTQLNKIWRQCFPFIVIALSLRASRRITNQKHFIYNYYQKLFHILIVSFFLGGRAPPHSSY
jgi:hypothetical protein